jgi:hypothetical protein
LPETFGTIDHIFPAGVGLESPSKCAVETLTPLANSLQKKIHSEFLIYQIQAMISHILGSETYTNTVIAIAWQHVDIALLATAFGAKDVPSGEWPDDCYGLVWKLTHNGDQTYSLTQIPQLLMYGDTEDIIVNPSKKSFCDELQTIDPRVFFSGPQPKPAGNFPNQAMTSIFQVPKAYVPEGMTEQFIFVSAGFLVTEQSIINNQIAAVLNFASEENDADELQIPFSDPQVDKRSNLPFELASDEKYYLNQLSKVGLHDSNENEMLTLVAAVQKVEELLYAPSPTQQKEAGAKNFIAQGNIVIHCHDGGSRSVTVAALYLYYKYYITTDIPFEAVYKSIIALRWNFSINNHPTRGICENAYQVLTTFEALFPKPILK